MKLAIIILSDPKAGDEATGRLFNALALAAEGKNAGDEVEITFSGAATRWPEVLQDLSHPAHDLYQSVQDKVLGVSCGCRQVFEGDACGLPDIKDHALPGTDGIASIRRYAAEGFETYLF